MANSQQPRKALASASDVGGGGGRGRRGASDGSYRGGEGVEDAGRGHSEGEDAADQQDAQHAGWPVEVDRMAVTGVAEDGFADDAEVVIDGDGGIDDGDNDEEDRSEEH